ncbi:hypothetical protein Slin15195_G103020 [Septoria linicola]|uniref:Uncharacterized protein n=1 Tax=Septoria linicola TaxID=215465 RepID=A0A9Q9B3S2_9PEZI|nr:hypothetical protein Slin14017_G066020 [Septoria linicola]USW56983.1 hypothetical protein Slin15195_G103020 [Septoria linicola]
MTPFSMETTTHRANDFYRTERLVDVPTPNLTQDIHPLFARSKFWGLPQSLEYPVLACRLASLLVEKALPFFHSILVIGDLTPGDPCTGKRCHSYPEPKTSLTLTAQQETRTRLFELSTWLIYSTNLTGDPDLESAQCRPMLGSRFKQMSGHGSMIDFNPAMLCHIQSAKTAGDHVKFLYYNCWLALSLVHELGHAAVYATTTWDCGEGFVGDSQSAEVGYLLEAFLFGGLLNLGPSLKRFGIDAPCYINDKTPSSLSYMICVLDYPNIDQIQDYADAGQNCPFRGEALPGAYALWNVPLSWLHNLFQQDFWDKALEGGNSYLRPPKTTGLVVPEGDQDLGSEHIRIYAAELAKSGKFEVNDQGIVTPVKPPKRRVSTRVKAGVSRAMKALVPRHSRLA